MKIWFAASIPETSCGGVQRSMRNFFGYLQNKGFQVKIIYSSKWDKGNYLLFSVKLGLMLLINLRKPPEWIIARSTDGFLCSLIIKIFHISTKLALHSHGWEEKALEVERRLPGALVTNPSSWKAIMIRFPLLRATLGLSKICICGTVEEARWISERYKSSVKKIRVVPNGIIQSEKPFWPLQNEFPFNFLMIGGFTWKKNLEYGVQLFKKILEKKPESKLYLIGTGEISEEKTALLNSLGDSLIINKREDPEKMDHWYQACPYLLFTSRYEGGRAFSVLEVQANGGVVFASDIPSTREIVIDKKNGMLLCGTDVNEDCYRILNMCSDPEKVKSIGMKAWKSVAANSTDRQGNRLVRILESVDEC